MILRRNWQKAKQVFTATNSQVMLEMQMQQIEEALDYLENQKKNCTLNLRYYKNKPKPETTKGEEVPDLAPWIKKVVHSLSNRDRQLLQEFLGNLEAEELDRKERSRGMKPKRGMKHVLEIIRGSPARSEEPKTVIKAIPIEMQPQAPECVI